ncbi:MAG: (2Fe-2S)-binding protein [Hyphomicrobiales bacterium]|nr:(2Fe-2S)-binding protein [Hyphomicrobiales bacterium]
MIVCSCNRLTDRDVRGCCAQPAGAPARVLDVYARLGCAPQCGKCAPTIAAILRSEKSTLACDCRPQNCNCAIEASGAEAA